MAIIRVKKEKLLLDVLVVTDSLTIRSYKESQFENLMQIYSDERLMKLFDDGKPKTRDEVAKFLKIKGEGYFKKGIPFGLFTIHKKENDEFLGFLDYLPTDKEGEVEFGVAFLRLAHNKGYPFEALKPFMRQFPEEISPLLIEQGLPIVRSIVATSHPKNFASKRVLRILNLNSFKMVYRYGSARELFMLTL